MKKNPDNGCSFFFRYIRILEEVKKKVVFVAYQVQTTLLENRAVMQYIGRCNAGRAQYAKCVINNNLALTINRRFLTPVAVTYYTCTL